MRFHSIGVAAIAHMAASAGISAGARMSKMTLILQGLFSSGISIFSRLSCCWFARGSVMRGQDPVGHSAHHLHALFIPHPSGEASHVAKPLPGEESTKCVNTSRILGSTNVSSPPQSTIWLLPRPPASPPIAELSSDCKSRILHLSQVHIQMRFLRCPFLGMALSGVTVLRCPVPMS